MVTICPKQSATMFWTVDDAEDSPSIQPVQLFCCATNWFSSLVVSPVFGMCSRQVGLGAALGKQPHFERKIHSTGDKQISWNYRSNVQGLKGRLGDPPSYGMRRQVEGGTRRKAALIHSALVWDRL